MAVGAVLQAVILTSRFLVEYQDVPEAYRNQETLLCSAKLGEACRSLAKLGEAWRSLASGLD
jgi:hypothetical protein